MNRKQTFLIITMLLFALALTACGGAPVIPSDTPTPVVTPTMEPTSQPTQVAESLMPETSLSPEQQEAADKAKTILADELKVDPDAVTILEVKHVTWRDGSLGCPKPGMMYTQVITPGYLVKAEVDGEIHMVHMDERGNGVVCSQDQARPPLEPAD
jgi:hypothetical protein